MFFNDMERVVVKRNKCKNMKKKNLFNVYIKGIPDGETYKMPQQTL